ncbi:MAG: bifunctional lysine ketoglutarate reductase /saccharopine dehydrogenase family protein [Bacteroidales bacterium]
MSVRIGIRHEDKYKAERRTPLIPRHVEEFIREQGLGVLVQQSPKRVFIDEEYRAAGATIVSDMKEADIIFGVKEIPIEMLEPRKTYVFFSHVIKGQPYNMPMLRKLLELGCTLIDYERITDGLGKRLIFFGRFAGLAGAINTLWTLGLRLKYYGYETPFLQLKQARHYRDLEEARDAISKVGFQLATEGLPEELCPFTIGITGYGNVSGGVQEILSLLPTQEISPEDLLGLEASGRYQNNLVYRVIFKEEHISAPNNSAHAFDLEDYYRHPENYHSIFEQYLPHLSVLINGMYWDARYPKILTRDYMLRHHGAGARPKLVVVGDITCDPNGSVEATLQGTEPDDPIYVYNPEKHEITFGYEGEGLQVMAVDILPSELPRDSSIAFSTMLRPFVRAIAQANYNAKNPDEAGLPAPIRRALIVCRGQLTPEYSYLTQYLK